MLGNIGGGDAAARSLLYNGTVPTLPDEGIRAAMLQGLCAAAALLVMCIDDTIGGVPAAEACTRCSRGVGSSGFMAAILRGRTALGLSIEPNQPGGVWSWPHAAH